MRLENDKNCSWINDLNTRNDFKSICSNINTDWLIIGAGLTGLSAARKLAEIYPKKKNCCS